MDCLGGNTTQRLLSSPLHPLHSSILYTLYTQSLYSRTCLTCLGMGTGARGSSTHLDISRDVSSDRCLPRVRSQTKSTRRCLRTAISSQSTSSTLPGRSIRLRWGLMNQSRRCERNCITDKTTHGMVSYSKDLMHTTASTCFSDTFCLA